MANESLTPPRQSANVDKVQSGKEVMSEFTNAKFALLCAKMTQRISTWTRDILTGKSEQLPTYDEVDRFIDDIQNLLHELSDHQATLPTNPHGRNKG